MDYYDFSSSKLTRQWKVDTNLDQYFLLRQYLIISYNLSGPL